MKKIFIPFTILGILILTANISAAKKFTDINENSPYYTTSRYLSEKGIINGYEDGTFKPDRNITRAELLKIIFEGNKTKTENPNTNCFPDVGYKEWYSKYVCAAKNLNIITGYKDKTFKPNQTISNAEGLKILGEFYKWNLSTGETNEVWYKKYIDFGKKTNLLDDSDNFNPDKKATRGEMSSILYRYLAKEEYKVEKFSENIDNKIAIKINADDIANGNTPLENDSQVISRNLTTPEIIELTPGEIKIVLSWEDITIPPEQEKTQFNSYLLQPTDEEISFQHKIDSKFDTIMETGKNSETITITHLKPDNGSKDYLYFVESINGKTTFNDAKIKVEIYDKNGLAKSVLAHESIDRIWKIFTLGENYEIRIFDSIGDCSLINRKSNSCPEVPESI
ncbi:S-layer homology domain-containing protein [Candidatus Peregrinibacteria bacterium]|nr:S-layer homology domain-containing protein [Candidatus Peregrinibacteria bacterium]